MTAVAMKKVSRTSTFQVEGITCLDCAAQFEKHVANLPKVTEATLNPVTGKLVVVGDADIEAIRKIGRGEDYTIRYESDTETATPTDTTGFKYVNAELARALLSGMALIIAASVQMASPSTTHPTAIVLYVAATFIGGWGNMKKAFYSLPRLDFNMSVLMTIAVFGAIAIGQWSEAGVVAFLFAVSEMLEAWALTNARRSITSLMDMAPKVATVKRGDQLIRLPVEEVHVGDVVVVRPGDTVSTDGTVLKGESSVDESPITGESIPVEKKPGSGVFAGTTNTFGALEVRVDKPAEQTTFAKILDLVEEAQTKKTTTEAFVDRFAALYTPIVIVLASLITVVPPLFFGFPWGEWIYRGLALLVVACPCALVISTPVAVVSAMSHAARNGVLIKGGIHLENAAKIKTFAFDKTGTLTRGKPVVTDVVPIDVESLTVSDDFLIQTAVDVESYSEHPLAHAILEEGKKRGIRPHHVANFEALSGRGAAATSKGKRLFAGNQRLFSELGIDTTYVEKHIHRLRSKGKTVVIVGIDDVVIGLIAVADDIRPTSADAVAALKRSGIRRTIMLTGDHEKSAATIAAKVGVDDYVAHLLPEDKVTAVEQLMDQYGNVAMVGDGINDTPALARATVGIAMGAGGTDAALETADIALMADDLSKLPFIVRLSEKTLRTIKQNVYFSVMIKIVAVAAIFPGWLTLWLAIMSDMGATIIVTLNGMRLFRRK